MNYNIIYPKGLTRKAKFRVFLRWFCYALVLVFFYSLMRSGIFPGWQPVFIISIAIAVSMRETEFSGAVFGVFAGLLLDIAVNDLFGFCAVSLMPCCMLTGLMCANLVKVNFFNHIVFTFVTCVVMAAMDFFFKYIIWNKEGSMTVFYSIILPSYLSTVILSPAVYFLIKFIHSKLVKKDIIEISEQAAQEEDEYTEDEYTDED